MLRSLALSLLGLAVLAGPATAQTTPARKPMAKAAAKPASRPAANRPAKSLPDSSSNKGSNSYAAPGQPVNSTVDDGKNLPPYDGPAAKPAARKGTTLTTPK